MNIIKRKEMWEPLDLMGELQNEMNRVFNRSFLKKDGWGRAFEPELDIIEEKDYFLVKADLPGIKKEDLDIEVEGRHLMLKGERREEKEVKEKNYYSSERFYGKFARMIELPSEIKASDIKATYKEGVLEIHLPKTESAKARQIKVEVKEEK